MEKAHPSEQTSVTPWLASFFGISPRLCCVLASAIAPFDRIAEKHLAMIHPLTGADLSTLLRLVRRYGMGAPGSRRALPGAFASAATRSPASLVEYGYMRWRGRSLEMPAPVFIVGHWRSGTTYLFNLLSGTPGFTYARPIPTGLPWNFLLLGRLLEPLLKWAIPRQRGIDPMAVTPDAPQEDEIALASMTIPSYYHGVYWPERFRAAMAEGLFFDGCSDAEIRRWQARLVHFTAKTSLRGGGRQVLIKNPAHTGRIARIRALWPDAKFIHIVRNPYHVYQSTRRMFTDLTAMLAFQPVDTDLVTRTLQESYPRMMDRLATDTADLPENQFIQIRFEDLTQDPLSVLERIARQLALAETDGLMDAARRHLESVAGYESRTREVPSDVKEAVNAHWWQQRERFGYAAQPPVPA